MPWLVTFPSIILTICPWPLKRTKSIENMPGKCILTLLGEIPQFFCEISKFVKAFLSNLWTKSILDTRPIAFNYWGGMIYGKKSLISSLSFLGVTYIVGQECVKIYATILCQSDWGRYIRIVWADSVKVTWEASCANKRQSKLRKFTAPHHHPHHQGHPHHWHYWTNNV